MLEKAKETTREGKYTHIECARFADGTAYCTACGIISRKDECDLSPSVKLTMPLNNTSYVGPANIRLAADASVKDCIIKSVEFYNEQR